MNVPSPDGFVKLCAACLTRKNPKCFALKSGKGDTTVKVEQLRRDALRLTRQLKATIDSGPRRELDDEVAHRRHIDWCRDLARRSRRPGPAAPFPRRWLNV